MRLMTQQMRMTWHDIEAIIKDHCFLSIKKSIFYIRKVRVHYLVENCIFYFLWNEINFHVINMYILTQTGNKNQP